MTVIYIVRHALTDAHQKRTVLSWTPGIVLNLEGRKQAFRVAEAIKDVELDEIISSPIERAYETASIIAQSKGMNVVKDGRFSEWNMGIWTGRHFDEVKREYPEEFSIWRKKPHTLEVKGGETLDRVAERMYNGLLNWANKCPEKTILIVSHKDPIRALLTKILKTDVEHIRSFEIEMASLSRITYRDNTFAIDLLNLIPWKPIHTW